MLVAITGHTSGIGQALRQHMVTQGHAVVGFSRSTGHDISSQQARQSIIDACQGVDLFINNACSGFAQVELLYGLHSRFSSARMLIVNIGSNSPDGIKPRPWPYSVHKAALDKATEQLAYQKSTCRVSNLRLGYVDVPRIAGVTDPKLSTDAVCQALDFIVARWVQGHVVKDLTMLP